MGLPVAEGDGLGVGLLGSVPPPAQATPTEATPTEATPTDATPAEGPATGAGD